ncbi:DUF6318 family protein, partial [Actinotalea ferrariae]|uniref:DUF6318 family protein n=1 Tax=Actinotalea ferrariae TaxID=1386098 RepID=UPI0005533A83
GAIAAAEYMVRLYAYALSTGELQEWEEVSSDTCEFCTNTRAEVERVYVPGGYFTGGEVESLFDTRVVGFDEQLGIYGVEVGFAISGGAEHAASGAVVDEFP